MTHRNEIPTATPHGIPFRLHRAVHAIASLSFLIKNIWGPGGTGVAKMGHFVAPSYSGKVFKAHPLTQSGSDMAAKILAWRVI